MAPHLDMTWHPWYDTYKSNNTMTNNGISYQRNFDELVWYQEYIYQDGNLIGEIFTDIENDGYNLRKLVECGEAMIFTNIAHFNSVCDAKSFVNQAGGL
jgi:hypothetical protein